MIFSKMTRIRNVGNGLVDKLIIRHYDFVITDLIASLVYVYFAVLVIGSYLLL